LPSREQWYWIVGALVLAVVVALGILHFRNRGSSPVIESKADVAVNPSLGFRFERDGTDVRLIWNADAAAIIRATDGDLIINDGPLTKTVHLDANDLKRGTITYSPLTSELVFRLNVNSPDSSNALSESVRIISGLPSAAVEQPGSPNEAALSGPSQLSHSISSSSTNPVLSETERAYQISAKKPVVPQAGRVQSSSELITRPVKLPGATVVHKTSPAGKAAPVRPTSDSGKSALNASKRDSDLNSIGAAPVSNHPEFRQTPELIPVLPANSASSISGATSAFSKRSGGTVQPAQLISNGNPQYPKSAKESGISGSVELRFKIGSTGDVYDVSVVKGPAVLAEAAAESVRARKYKPARVDGVPTETEASAVFDFRLN
jgi:TonB family protein